jgi:beta-glucosidase
VAACAKHFVGDGGTQNGINENNTIIDRDGLMSIHMPAYLDALRKGVSTVMISYSSWNGLKMHANHDLITRFLKGRLNFQVNEKNRCAYSLHQVLISPLELGVLIFCSLFFPQGFTISDWEGIDRITSPPGANYSYSVQASILAGIDMVSKTSIDDMARLWHGIALRDDDDADQRTVVVCFRSWCQTTTKTSSPS